MNNLSRHILCGPFLAAMLLALLPGAAMADDRNAPVTFLADDVQYDREGGIVTATGHVEAWQNERTLLADKVVFDRNSGVAAATGHVVLVGADGQVAFADYAELTDDFKDGVLTGIRTILEKNGKLAGTAARRTNGTINEMTRAIYTTCNLCIEDPTRAPLWDVRARSAVQDTEHKQIEYRDAIVEIFGVPVLYTPYLSHPDPSQSRASGLLVPSFGYGSKHLGTFFTAPYYVVLDQSSDITLAPLITAKAGQAVDFDYRLRLNDGRIRARGSIADEFGRPQGHLFSNGDFTIDETWRWGFNVNRVSGALYARDYRLPLGGATVLPSTVFIEGFGQDAYTRTDMRFYQKFYSSGSTGQIPFVLPRTEYSYLGQPDALGGRLALDAGAFNVVRSKGTSTMRANLSADWDRPFETSNGQQINLGLHVDSATYSAFGMNQTPNYGTTSNVSSTQVMPTVYADWRWPFMRASEDGWGSQVIEPIVKFMGGPRGPTYRNSKTPNEDSLDVEFSDANLFALNRNPGIDRLEGGARVAVGLHGAWYFPQGGMLDGLVGQSYRASNDPYFNDKSGLRGTVSDIVARQSLKPVPYFDLTMRERFDHDTMQTRFADFTTTVGNDLLTVSAGYIYSNTNIFYYYENIPGTAAAQTALNTPRNELSLGAETHVGAWRVSGNVRQDLQLHRPSSFDSHITYENECLIFDVVFYRRYSSVLSDTGDSGLLFSITLKTVGEFGFHGG